MDIDKRRFLILTSSIAAASAGTLVSAAGCSKTAAPPDPRADVANEPRPETDAAAADLDGASDGPWGPEAPCLGSGGPELICGPAVEGVPDDSGVVQRCPRHCQTARSIFKNEVATDISACLELHPTIEGDCDLTAAGPCIASAVDRACDDPEASTFCTTLLAACADAGPPVTRERCERFVRAMTVEGRDQLRECATIAGCDHCLDAIAFDGSE